MSAKIMGGVFDLKLTPPQQIVLLAYADHADHFGKNVFPSKRLIAWKTGYGVRQVQRVTDQLVALEIMRVEETPSGKVIKYSIDLSKGGKKPPFDEKKNNPRQDDTPVIAMTPHLRHSYDTPTPDMPVRVLRTNHQVEPSVEPSVKPNGTKPLTPFVEMKNAIHAAFGYDKDKTTPATWNLIGKAASELLKVGATPADINGLHKYCASKFDNFKAMALATNWSDYLKAKQPATAKKPYNAFEDTELLEMLENRRKGIL